jgi:Ser/Thr protein kinase RdoA (MazF antagonist)
MSGLNEASSLLPDFSSLSPSLVAEAAEAVLDQPIDGTLVPYPSYVNRVYGLTTGDGRKIIAKFYRPGRWTEEAVREEHSFVSECAAAGIPVPKAIADRDGEGLSMVSVEDEEGQERTFLFALYPFISGRGWEAETDEDWIQLGRLIAAIHAVGRRRAAPTRTVIHPERSTRLALRRLLDGSFVHPDLRFDFEEACAETLDRINPLFENLAVHRLHGDLHRGNLLRCRWSGSEADGNGFADMAIIDFDDMASGPAVQDLWLFLPGRLDESRRELGLILEGYEETLPFDRSQVNLIEPLRFMRMIGYLDWQARQRADAGFLRAFPDWGSRPFWIKEVEDLRDQARIVIEGIG